MRSYDICRELRAELPLLGAATAVAQPSDQDPTMMPRGVQGKSNWTEAPGWVQR